MQYWHKTPFNQECRLGFQKLTQCHSANTITSGNADVRRFADKVTFSKTIYLVIVEHPVLPSKLLDVGITMNMTRGLHNDADTKTDGRGLYYENGKLVVGVHPSMLPDPSKPAVDPNLPKPVPPAKSNRGNPDGSISPGNPKPVPLINNWDSRNDNKPDAGHGLIPSVTPMR